MLRWSVLQPTGVKTGTEREALGRRAVRICESKDASRFAHGQQCAAGVASSYDLNSKRTGGVAKRSGGAFCSRRV